MLSGAAERVRKVDTWAHIDQTPPMVLKMIEGRRHECTTVLDQIVGIMKDRAS